MRILIACEESQAVTKAFRALGLPAVSCDLEPCSGGHPEWHLQQDVIPLLQQEWDLIIAFPPCTDLAASGAAYFKQKQADGRQQASIDFFMLFANANSPRIAIENPVGIMSSRWRRPNQIIQPYWFGDSFSKKTCLWLKGLPPLVPTNVVDKGEFITYPDGRRAAKWYANLSGRSKKQRAKLRSKTFPGIAAAMATQWGLLLQSLPVSPEKFGEDNLLAGLFVKN